MDRVAKSLKLIVTEQVGTALKKGPRIEALVIVGPPQRLRTHTPYVHLQEEMEMKDLLAAVEHFRSRLPQRPVEIRLEESGPIVDTFLEIFNGPKADTQGL